MVHNRPQGGTMLHLLINNFAAELSADWDCFISAFIFVRTSSQQCMRAMASERRIMLSSCRTVILQADLETPPEPSLCRRRLYCSTMNSSDSLEICKHHTHEQTINLQEPFTSQCTKTLKLIHLFLLFLFGMGVILCVCAFFIDSYEMSSAGPFPLRW